MVESAREVCGSVRVGGKNPKSVRFNDQVRAAVKRKEAAWEEVFGERCLEVYKEKRRNFKRCIYQSKNEVYE